MLKKETILVGTEVEILEHFNKMNLINRTSEEMLKVIINNEFKQNDIFVIGSATIESQIKNRSKNPFAIMYLELVDGSIEEDLQVNLNLKADWVWVRPNKEK